jgi:hypothetical protein
MRTFLVDVTLFVSAGLNPLDLMGDIVAMLGPVVLIETWKRAGSDYIRLVRSIEASRLAEVLAQVGPHSPIVAVLGECVRAQQIVVREGSVNPLDMIPPPGRGVPALAKLR